MAPEMSYLALDHSKLARARKAAMESSRENDKDKYKTENIVGMSYDGRRDKHLQAMVADSSCKLIMRVVTKEHKSVTNEPSGRFLSHFTPETPVHTVKPALKVAQGLFIILEQHNSTDSIQFLAED